MAHQAGGHAILEQHRRFARGELARAQFRHRACGGFATNGRSRFQGVGVACAAVPVATLHRAVPRADHRAVHAMAGRHIARAKALRICIGTQAAIDADSRFIDLRNLALCSAGDRGDLARQRNRIFDRDRPGMI